MDSRTKATALQNRALLDARRQDAASIQELQAANDDLAATAKQTAAVEVTDCQTPKGKRLTQVCSCLLQHLNIQQSLLVLAGRTFVNRKQLALKVSCLQGLCLSPGMLDAKIKATALQNSVLKAAKRQDAVRMQQLIDADTQLQANIAQQAVTIAEQEEVINCQKSALAQSDRRLSVTSKLLSNLWGRRKVEAIDLDHMASDSHVESLKSEKQGLQKTLEETHDELAKEKQRHEYAWSEAQHRAQKRQELQVHMGLT